MPKQRDPTAMEASMRHLSRAGPTTDTQNFLLSRPIDVGTKRRAFANGTDLVLATTAGDDPTDI